MATPPLTRPRAARLTSRKEFVHCYDAGQKHHTRYFLVFSALKLGEPGGRGRLGFAVSRKMGCAVERNRIKRVLREFFRLHQALLPTLDVVVTPKRHLRADRISLDMVSKDLLPLVLSLARGRS